MSRARSVRPASSGSRLGRARSPRAPRFGALVPLLAVLGGACDAPGAATPGASEPVAQIAAINVNPGQTVATTIRIDGLAWKASASNEIVSALPVFMVRAEGAGQRFQIVEQPGTSCDLTPDAGSAIGPAAAAWKAASDPDGYQTITTGEGVRHFCAFVRDVTTKATTATAFDVTVAPTAKFPYSATDFTLDEEPSVQGTYSVPAGANANISVRFIAGFGMRNSGRWSSQTVAPAATPYDAQVVVPPGWPANTVSFKPPTGTTASLANWEKFGLNYVKTAGTEAKLRLFGADIATRGFEPLATLMTKLGHLSAWQLYRLDSLFRVASNLVAANSPSKWQGFLNGIPDWRGFRRWRDLLWTNVEGSATGPRMYFGRTWLATGLEGTTPNLPPVANGLMPGLTLDAAGMAFWATFKFPQTIGRVTAQLPDGERVANPFTRSAAIQEKAIRLALVTTFYEGLTLARSIRLSAADADPANECRTDEYIGPHLQTMFKAIDTLLPSMIGKPEFEGTIPALKAMTQYFLEYLVSLPVSGGGGTNMCLPEVAAAYYAARWNPSDAYWRYLRDVREHAVYERVYPAIYYHEHASFSLEASYEGNANARNVELCSVFKSPLACAKLYLSNRLKSDLMLAEPDYVATGKTRIGQFKGPSGTNTSTPESAARDQAAVASRDELTDTFFPGMFGYLVAHARRSFIGHLLDAQDLSAYRALTDADLARRETLEALSGTSERAAYNQTHAGYFTTVPGIQDWFLLPEAEVPVPAQIYNPANYHCGSYAKFTTDSLVAATSESTEAGGATYPQVTVANAALSTLAAPTVARLPSFAYAARPGVVRYNMPRPELGAQFREDTYLRFDGTAYSASFYAGTTGWSQGVEYANSDEPDVTRTPSVRGFGPGLLSFSVFGTNAAQSVTARNLTGPVMLSESDGAQTPNSPTANWLDRAEEFAHPAIVGIARRAGTSADCAGRFTTVRQRYAGSTKVVETRTAGVLSALSVNTRGFVNQELNFKDANGAYLTGAANKAKVDLLKSAAAKVCDAFPTGLLVSPYLCTVATVPSNNMGYGTMDLVRQAPNGTQCTELPLPFTLEFNRNYVARAAYLDATVNLKAPNPGGLGGFTPPVILKSTTDNVVFSQLDEVIPVYHDVREVAANGVFEPDAAGSSKVYVRVTGGTWQRLAWGVAGATAGPVAAQEIFVARYQGGMHIKLTGAARMVRITEPPDLTATETGNHGATQNVLVSLLPDPAQVPAGGYAGTYGAANAVNFALTYRLLPRETNALPQ